MTLNIYNNVVEQITEQEKKEIVPLLIDCLFNTNEKTLITSTQLSKYLKACGLSKSPARVRKIISYMVCVNVKSGKETSLGSKIIIGDGRGYFATSQLPVVDDQIETLLKKMDNLKSRVDSIRAQRQQLVYEQKQTA